MTIKNFKNLSWVVIVVATLLNMSVTIAAEILLGVANFNAAGASSEQLIVIDRFTGAATLVSTLDSPTAPIGLSDRGGKLYTYSEHQGRVLEIDPATAGTLATVDIGSSITTEGAIAFRSDGTGFVASGGLHSFEIDPPSNSFLGYLTGVSGFQGMDFDASDVLYGLTHSFETNTNWLYTIDEITLSVTLVGDTGIISQNLAGMTFMPDGTLLAVLSDKLYNLDKTSGSATLIGSIGFGSISGLTALAEEEPEPPIPPDLSPVITVNDIVAVASSSAGAIVNYTVSATDDVDGALTPACNPPSGTTFPLGITTVECRVSDSAGNDSNNSFTVTVNDETPPNITVPINIQATAFRASGTIVDFEDDVQASDSISQIESLTCDLPSGSKFPIGQSTVTCTAIDQFNNDTSADFSIDVKIGVPLNLSENEKYSKNPLISVFGENTYMVWDDFDNDNSFTDVFFWAVQGNQTPLREGKINLSRSTSGAGNPHLVAQGSNAYIVWEQDNSTLQKDVFIEFISVSQNIFSRNGQPVNLSRSLNESTGPQIVASGNILYVVWVEDSGQFQNPSQIKFMVLELISAPVDNQIFNIIDELQIDAPGGLEEKTVRLLVSGNTVFVVFEGHSPDSSSIFLTRIIDDFGTYTLDQIKEVSDDTTIEGNGIRQTSRILNSRLPQITTNNDNVQIAWEGELAIAPDNRHVFLYNSRSGDPYEGKAKAITYGQAGLQDARKPKIAIDSGNNLYVVWHHSSANQKPSLYQVWFLDNDGEITQVNETEILNELGSSAQNPQISTSQEEVYIAWEQRRTENFPDHQYGVILEEISNTPQNLALTRDGDQESSYEPQMATGGGEPQLVWHEMSSIDSHDTNAETFYWKQSFAVSPSVGGDDKADPEKPYSREFWIVVVLIAIGLGLGIFFARARISAARFKV